MGRINEKLEASTLPECIVAAVIFMIVFLVALEILSSIALRNDGGEGRLAAEQALRQCREAYGRNIPVTQPLTRTYEWGTVRMEAVPYRGSVYRIDLIATLKKEGTKIRYRYLVNRKVLPDDSKGKIE